MEIGREIESFVRALTTILYISKKQFEYGFQVTSDNILFPILLSINSTRIASTFINKHLIEYGKTEVINVSRRLVSC